jgi:hypothetical protein
MPVDAATGVWCRHGWSRATVATGNPGPGGGSSHGEAADSESPLHRQVGADLDRDSGPVLVLVLVSGS